jgi:hypothetical protein
VDGGFGDAPEVSRFFEDEGKRPPSEARIVTREPMHPLVICRVVLEGKRIVGRIEVMTNFEDEIAIAGDLPVAFS